MGLKKKVNVSADKASADILAGIKNGIDEICSDVEADAVLNVHVDSGDLKKSISSEVEQNNKSTTGTVGAYMDYAYWEDIKHPYLSLAVDQNMGRFNDIMQRNIKAKVGE